MKPTILLILLIQSLIPLSLAGHNLKADRSFK
jgi:hypothetical protein